MCGQRKWVMGWLCLLATTSVTSAQYYPYSYPPRACPPVRVVQPVIAARRVPSPNPILAARVLADDQDVPPSPSVPPPPIPGGGSVPPPPSVETPKESAPAPEGKTSVPDVPAPGGVPAIPSPPKDFKGPGVPPDIKEMKIPGPPPSSSKPRVIRAGGTPPSPSLPEFKKVPGPGEPPPLGGARNAYPKLPIEKEQPTPSKPGVVSPPIPPSEIKIPSPSVKPGTPKVDRFASPKERPRGIEVEIPGTKPRSETKTSAQPIRNVSGEETPKNPNGKETLSSPWVVRVEIVDTMTHLIARSKTAEFRVLCRSLKMQSPTGNIEAEGKIKMGVGKLELECDRLVISWQNDWVRMEGAGKVRTQQDVQQIELSGEAFNLKLTTLGSPGTEGAVRTLIRKSGYLDPNATLTKKAKSSNTGLITIRPERILPRVEDLPRITKQ